MTTIKATVEGGRLELDVPSDWPDGTQVEIHPVVCETTDDGLSPEEITQLLAVMDQLEPLQLTDSELAAWKAERQARADWEKAQFADHADQLQRMWK